MQPLHYSLVRYKPSDVKGEIINIGIVVFTEEPSADLFFIPSAGKVQSIDPGFNNLALSQVKDYIKKICSEESTPEKKYKRLYETYDRKIIFSEAASFYCSSPQQYRETTTNLYDILVRPTSSAPAYQDRQRVKTKIKKLFENYKLLSIRPEGIENRKVVIDYPLDRNGGLTVDFAFKYEEHHITEVIDFSIKDLNTKFNEAGLKAITLVQSKELLGVNTETTVLYSANASQERNAAKHITLLNKYCDQMYNSQSSQEMRTYMDYVREHISR